MYDAIAEHPHQRDDLNVHWVSMIAVDFAAI
jgi:hypothetical protein